jgi:hypothetical protein
MSPADSQDSIAQVEALVVVGDRQPWSAPTFAVIPARDAQADQGGIHYDGHGFIS